MPKRLVCLLLVCLMLITTVACATSQGGNENLSQDTQDFQIVQDSDTISVETELKLDLPAKDYGGASFRILGKQESLSYVLSDKTVGETVGDALVEANMWVSNHFGLVEKA